MSDEDAATQPGSATPTEPPAPPGPPPPPAPPAPPPPAPPLAATAPVPVSAPPPAAAPPSPAAARTPRGGPPPLVTWIVAGVAVLAIVFAIVGFAGKSSAESDRRDLEAQVEDLEGNIRDLDDENADLVAQVEALGGESDALNEVVRVGETAAIDLKTCTDLTQDFLIAFSEAIPDIITSGGDIPPGLQEQADDADAACLTADLSYEDFADALADL